MLPPNPVVNFVSVSSDCCPFRRYIQTLYPVLILLIRVHLTLKGALQLLMNRYGSIRLAHAHERVLPKSFVVLIIGNSKSFHLSAQGTCNPTLVVCALSGSPLARADAPRDLALTDGL